MKPQFLLLHLILAITLMTSCSSQQKASSSESLIDWFATEDLPQLTLRTNMDAILNEKAEMYQSAQLEWPGRDTLDIKVKTRGKTRKEICDFPPLKLRFQQEDLQRYQLADFSTIKLVSQCIADSTLVLKEYLAYKMYNSLTEKSFKVQLIRIRYVNPGDEAKAASWQYAFLIEHHDALAHRLGGKIVKGSELKSIAKEDYQRLTIFQYMIGNTDWNLSKHHNIKLLELKHQSAPIPVPYDFDYSGLINAPYAKPHPSLPIESVQDRFFQWRGKHNDGLVAQLQLIINQKQNIIQICESFPYLTPTKKAEVCNYLNTFFVDAHQLVAGNEGLLAAHF